MGIGTHRIDHMHRYAPRLEAARKGLPFVRVAGDLPDTGPVARGVCELACDGVEILGDEACAPSVLGRPLAIGRVMIERLAKGDDVVAGSGKLFRRSMHPRDERAHVVVQLDAPRTQTAHPLRRIAVIADRELISLADLRIVVNDLNFREIGITLQKFRVAALDPVEGVPFGILVPAGAFVAGMEARCLAGQPIHHAVGALDAEAHSRLGYANIHHAPTYLATLPP
ncbi:hypothetical protein CHELA1G11_11600 [Hyphomicrobiales bacterium]|nr:hypothetical protein CHELA1G11_11600 [Hyphomicrobiales bacterium]CAH1666623.1 hypothetical protein CHELA1G2_12708 [Hyphomicrobiales bacterium]